MVELGDLFLRIKKDLKSKKEGVDYDRLIRQGVCFECGDEVIDYGFVEDHILTLEEKIWC